ncbi:hypothetical protein U0070_009182 [Myodes glareolus]|uniref:Uncharacterized protein n=1 Tax=Myodes glareolus TaxID=447135 RepID=A0AAW0HBP4_MYOGA
MSTSVTIGLTNQHTCFTRPIGTATLSAPNPMPLIISPRNSLPKEISHLIMSQTTTRGTEGDHLGSLTAQSLP